MPFSLNNGSVVCEDTSHLYDSDCDFICDSGFTLSGTQRKMTCQADQTWSVASSDVNCQGNHQNIFLSSALFYLSIILIVIFNVFLHIFLQFIFHTVFKFRFPSRLVLFRYCVLLIVIISCIPIPYM